MAERLLEMKWHRTELWTKSVTSSQIGEKKNLIWDAKCEPKKQRKLQICTKFGPTILC